MVIEGCDLYRRKVSNNVQFFSITCAGFEKL